MTKPTVRDLFTVTEIEISYRSKVRACDRLKVTKANDAYDILYYSWNQNKIDFIEEFKILLLDTSNACLGISNISTGGLSSCLVDPRHIFALSLKAKASSLILAHNHPSGNLSPSKADLILTQKLVDAGKLLDIRVLDHLILGNHSYLSMADDGLLPSPNW